MDEKSEMMNLWKKVFHDPSEYIAVIFDTYYEKGWRASFKTEDGIAAQIIGVPYEFKYNDKFLRGLYLCGISTEQQYRRQGIMTGLLREITDKATGFFDFLFLIPSNELNRQIYSEKGFYNAIYKVYEYYASAHNFKEEYDSTLYGFDDRVKSLKKKLFANLSVIKVEDNTDPFLSDITGFIQAYEMENRNYLNLIHSDEDLQAVYKDIFLFDGKIFTTVNKDSRLTGVMFAVPEDDGRIKVYAQYCNDPATYFKLLDGIKNHYSMMSLNVMRIPEEVKGEAIWSETNIVPNPDGQSLESLVGIETRAFYSSDNAKPYGMVKVLDLQKILDILAYMRKDIVFNVILKRADDVPNLLIEVAQGKVKLSETTENCNELKKKYKNVSILSERNFYDIIFRKKVKDDIIMEAFGIPRLPLNISLMLD